MNGKWLWRVVVIVILAAVVAGCARTWRVMEVRKSGFLKGHYGQLTVGDPEKHEGALRYVNPETDWAAYNKIELAPIVLYRNPEEEGIPREDATRLMDYFYSKIYTTLGEDYEMVEKPQPNTLRVQVAVTKLEASWVVPDVISTLHPGGLLLTATKGYATGQPGFTGHAAFEAKVSDAQTGKFLAATVDKRSGGKQLGKGWTKWSDAENAMDYWAAQYRYRLCRIRGGTDCPPP